MIARDLLTKRNKLKAWYLKLRPAYCKILSCDVLFKKNGLKHVYYNTKGKRRNAVSIEMRMMLIKHAPMVIRNCHKITDARVIGNITFYELTHSFSKKRIPIVVVLRRVKDGPIHYYSVRYGKTKKDPGGSS